MFTLSNYANHSIDLMPIHIFTRTQTQNKTKTNFLGGKVFNCNFRTVLQAKNESYLLE